ncbi:sensor histidine kinase response regulator, PAS domain-containing [Citrifermentans bemidjiense Bem]|uniref:histidine kinase n=1 Tax=Citrifermentans bemidjiense (strain ATCC BAA-1014 / DSM 16622 / JCM 12645 / Bem) TaxID=404380 RepID=B5E9Q6_CITBB|nr:PAS domain S-box protein [Citrifermentans bemidjiense]ACH40230.1 sensor histidine kinase response regulator, PAS domain-containing [Citrifermentans bemidjiense Bem]
MFHSLQNWQTLFDSMSQGMFCQNAEGSPVEANASALSLLGLDREAFMAHTPQKPQWRLLAQDGGDLPPEQHPASVALTKGEAVTGFTAGIYTPHNDATIWVKIDAIPIQQGLVCVVLNDITQEKLIKEQEHQAALQYELLANTSMDGFWVVDMEGEILSVNEAACRMYGYSRDEFSSMFVYEIEAREDRHEVRQHTEKVAATRYDRFETVHRTKDGTLIEVEVSTTFMPQNRRFLTFLQDITSKKDAERALQQSEEKYRSLFDNMLNGFAYCKMILDSDLPMDFVFLEVNQSFEKLTGLREVKGKRMSEVLPGVGNSDPELLAAFRRVALSGEPEQVEYFLCAINEWLAVSVYSPEPGCFVAVFDVITKRKRTEECLAFLAQAVSEPGEQFFHRLAKYLAQALDMEFICIDQLEEGNQYARTLAVYFDGSFEDNIRYTLRDTPCGEVVGNSVCCYRQGVRHLFPTDTLLQEIKAESYMGTVLWGSNGVPIGLIAAIGKKPLGNRDLPQEIFQMVSSRAAAEMERGLHEEERLRLEHQLLHAQKLESLGILAGGIAHDFNNILTGILGNSSLGLMRIDPDSPAAENLQNIEKAAVRAADLAKQMLAYSGKGMFVVEPVNLNLLLEEMIHLLEVSVSKKAELKLSLAQELPPVQADPTQLRQIVMNLVINASEATGEQGGTISISTGYRYFDQSYLKEAWFDCELAEGEFVFLQVADTGCGMDESTLLRIFDPFFTTKFTGRGLGMSAVLGIIRGHKGAIKVQSKTGEGTTFTVLLPASDLPVLVKEADQKMDNWQGSGTILLVDDEETICDIGAMMLGQLGYEVVTALSGSSALQTYRSRPDIKFVILDLTMPQMDGEQTFDALRALDPEVKVIMSSGYSAQEVTGKFTGTGLLDFIQKPYSMQALLEVMKRCDR